jgi:phosphatidylglycerophosphate synthase
MEHGRGGPLGPIWNELPDRIADGLCLVGAGYGGLLAGAFQAEPAGWLAAILAVLTAYVRELGRGFGLAADFSGPGAKPQRMAVLTAAAVLAGACAPTLLNGLSAGVLTAGLGLIVLLTGATCVRRTLHVARALRARGLQGS